MTLGTVTIRVHYDYILGPGYIMNIYNLEPGDITNSYILGPGE